jgi:hypothetical protein
MLCVWFWYVGFWKTMFYLSKFLFLFYGSSKVVEHFLVIRTLSNGPILSSKERYCFGFMEDLLSCLKPFQKTYQKFKKVYNSTLIKDIQNISSLLYWLKIVTLLSNLRKRQGFGTNQYYFDRTKNYELFAPIAGPDIPPKSRDNSKLLTYNLVAF